MNVYQVLPVGLGVLLLSQSLFPGICAAQLKPGRLSREQRESLVPGLRGVFESDVSGQLKQDERVDRFAALFVGAGESPADFLPPGAFKVRYTGFLKLKLKGAFRFQIYGRGTITLKLNDQTVFEGIQGDFEDAPTVEVELVRGYNAIELEYLSQPDGAGQFRVYWSSDEFVMEPIPSTSLFSYGDSAELISAQRLRRGRELVESHLCLQCHDMPAELEQTRTGADRGEEDTMAATRPFDKLDWRGIEGRVNSDWLQQWLLDPAKLRNETRMPKLLAHLPAKQARQASADIATFVLESAVATPDSRQLPGESKRGAKLFEDRGCIACHVFSPADQEDEYRRISLHFVASKFVIGSLKTFLLNPREHYSSSRMPVPDLSAAEAEDLEAFLREFSTGRIEGSFPEGDAERGKELVSNFGCFNCHSAEQTRQVEPTRHGEIFAKSEFGGCLQPVANREGNPAPAPAFEFDEDARAAIVEFLKTDGRGLQQRNLAEYANRQFANLRCDACHQRDDQDSHYFYVLQEEGIQGLAPDAVPDLTVAGEKLLSEWMQKQIEGSLPYRTREHFRLRMPGFPDRARKMALGVAAQHGFGPQEDRRPDFSRQLAEAGERIAAMEVGLGCRRCHAIKEQQPNAPFDAYSTNLSYATDRIRHEYYLRWMFNPQRVDPATRMLKFSPDLKTTGFAKEFDGDAARQFEALWHYLQSIEEKAEKINLN